jgi:hypothetical protein
MSQNEVVIPLPGTLFFFFFLNKVVRFVMGEATGHTLNVMQM